MACSLKWQAMPDHSHSITLILNHGLKAKFVLNSYPDNDPFWLSTDLVNWQALQS